MNPKSQTLLEVHIIKVRCVFFRIILLLLPCLHLAYRFEHSVSHIFKLLLRETVKRKMSESRIEHFLAIGTSLGDFFCIIAHLFYYLKAVKRTEVSNLSYALFGELLLKKLNVTARLLWIYLKKVKMVGGLYIVCIEKLRNDCVVLRKSPCKILGSLTADADDLLVSLNLKRKTESLYLCS